MIKLPAPGGSRELTLTAGDPECRREEAGCGSRAHAAARVPAGRVSRGFESCFALEEALFSTSEKEMPGPGDAAAGGGVGRGRSGPSRGLSARAPSPKPPRTLLRVTGQHRVTRPPRGPGHPDTRALFSTASGLGPSLRRAAALRGAAGALLTARPPTPRCCSWHVPPLLLLRARPPPPSPRSPHPEDTRALGALLWCVRLSCGPVGDGDL